METFLNILWVLIAAAGLATWQLQWVRQKRGQPRNAMREWTAMVAALILLFFAVSLTDDLHSDILLLDECATGRRHAAICTRGHGSPHEGNVVHATRAAVMPRLNSPAYAEVAGTIFADSHSSIRAPELRCFFGRAPPISNPSFSVQA
jgi:hypothetical protein